MELPSNFTLEELLAYGDLSPAVERIINNAIDERRDFEATQRDLSKTLAEIEEVVDELRAEVESLKSDIDRLKAEIAANKDRFDPDWIYPDE
jgi:peptidoglycan hydrolase CwlO-like protein